MTGTTIQDYNNYGMQTNQAGYNMQGQSSMPLQQACMLPYDGPYQYGLGQNRYIQYQDQIPYYGQSQMTYYEDQQATGDIHQMNNQVDTSDMENYLNSHMMATGKTADFMDPKAIQEFNKIIPSKRQADLEEEFV